MKPERWSQVRRLLEEALELTPARREAFVQARCSEDAELAEEVLRLLALESEQTGSTQARHLEAGAFEQLFTQVPSAGAHIGPYELVRELGAGGMGRVYEAIQASPRRTVALKVMAPGSRSSDSLRRFEYEAEIVARLEHPDIARVYDAGTWSAEDGAETATPYLAMELVPDARDLVCYANEEALTLEARIALFARVCDAVHHGHQKGVIHRDLKPHNILVDAEGAPKVIDFGVARMVDRESSIALSLTGTGQVVGTLRYMSPEQLSGAEGDIDTRSDVYSLGVVLFELLCSELPYGEESTGLAGLTVAILNTDPTPPSSLNPQIPVEIDWIVLKTLEKEREQRYSSAAELAADLGRHLQDEAVLAGPPSTIYRLRKFVRRHRASVASAALVFLGLLVAVIVTSRMYLQAREAQAAEELQKAEAEQQRDRADEKAQLAEEQRERADSQAQAAAAARTEAEGQRDQARSMSDFLFDSFRSLSATPTGVLPQVTDLLETASNGMSTAFATQPASEAELRSMLADTYLSLGLYADSERERRESVELHREVAGPESVETLQETLFLARTLAQLDRLREGQEMLEDCLETSERALGPEHVTTGRSAWVLAQVFMQRSRPSKALPLYQRARPILERSLGPEHSSVLQLLGGLAICQADLGQLEEGLNLLREVCATQERVLGEDHPRSQSELGKLADLLARDEQWAEACAVSERLWRSRVAGIGPEHPATLYTRTALGGYLLGAGHLEAAEEHLRAAYQAQVKVLGPTSSDTLKTLASITHIMRTSGRLQEAAAIQEELLVDMQAAVGVANATYLITLANLAITRWEQGSRDAAIQHLQRALDIWEEIDAASGPQAYKVLLQLAQWQYEDGRNEDALENMSRTIELGNRLLGADNLTLVYLATLKGHMLMRLGREEEARSLITESHSILARELGTQHPYTDFSASLLEQLQRSAP